MRTGGGALTATTSLAAHRAVKALDAYSASKAAVAGVVRSLTAPYSPAIRINAVSPGAVASELSAPPAETHPGRDVTWSERSHVPVGNPEALAYAHLLLFSS